MSIKAKIATGAATFALVGSGLGMAGTLTASAATPSCGANCVQIFSQKYGPRYVVDTYQARAKAGQPAILFQSSNSDPAEDFTFSYLGSVHSFYRNHGLVSAAFDPTYPQRPDVGDQVHAVRPGQQLLPVPPVGRGPGGGFEGQPRAVW